MSFKFDHSHHIMAGDIELNLGSRFLEDVFFVPDKQKALKHDFI